VGTLPEYGDSSRVTRRIVEGVIGLPFAGFYYAIALNLPSAAAIAGGMLVVACLLFLLAFEYIEPRARSTSRRWMWRFVVACALLTVVYLFLLAVFTVPTGDDRIVKGFNYTDVVEKYRTVQPNATDFEILERKEFKAEEVWTPPSILPVKVLLMATWGMAFACFAMSIYLFEISVMKRNKSAEARAKNQEKKEGESATEG
jgi:hypothetical protein